MMANRHQKNKRYSFKAEIRIEDIKVDQKISPNVQSWSMMRLQTLMIDKSQLISKVSSMKGGTIITRPRRWGKTINMSMVQCFFNYPLKKDGTLDKVMKEFHKTLFVGDRKDVQLENVLNKSQLQKYKVLLKKGGKRVLYPLKIAKNNQLFQRYFAQYIVLKFNFQIYWPVKNGLQGLKNAFVKQFQQFYKLHDYLGQKITKQRHQLQIAIQKGVPENKALQQYIVPLIKELQLYHQKQIIILVDQYDHTYNHFLNELDVKEKTLREDAKQIAKLISNFLSRLVKGWKKPTVSMLLCTGIRNIIMKQGPSENNAFAYETIDYCPATYRFYGFTKQEIKQELLEYIFVKSQHIQNALQIIQRNYNGYQIQKSKIYNPYSVTNYLFYIVNVQYFENTPQKIDQKLCFWADKCSGQDLFFKYLSISDEDNLTVIIDILKSVLTNQEKIAISGEVRGTKREIQYIDQDIISFTYPEAIHYLITTGYLSQHKDQIFIPNLQIRSFFQKHIPQYLKAIFRSSISLQDKRNFDISNWKSCEKILNVSLTEAFTRFLSKNEALMNALTILECYDLLKEKYFMQFERFFQKKMKPDIIFFPQSCKYQIGVIHEHKIINLDQSMKKIKQTHIQKKLQEAYFQIFNKGYFQAFFHEDYKQYKWDQLIIRGVVGYTCEDTKAFQLEAKQQCYSKRDIQVFCSYHNLGLNKNAKNIKQFIVPKTRLFKKKQIFQDTKEFFQILKENFNPKTFLKNYAILKHVKDYWKGNKSQLLNLSNFSKFLENIDDNFDIQIFCCELYLRFYGQKPINKQILQEQLKRIADDNEIIKKIINKIPQKETRDRFITWGLQVILNFFKNKQIEIQPDNHDDDFEKIIRTKRQQQMKKRKKYDYTNEQS